MYRIAIYIMMLLSVQLLCSGQDQNHDGQNHIEGILESVVDNLNENTDGSMVIEDLEGFLLNRLNINTATHAQLSKLHMLDEVQINKLLEYREQYGPLLTIYELNAIDGLYPDLIMNMEPFIMFGPALEQPASVAQILNQGRHELLLRTQSLLQKPAGYKLQKDGLSPFKGNPYRYYARYRYQSADHLSAGFTAGKDPGEPFFSASNPSGFDFYSAHLCLKGSKVIERVIIGDYVVRSGQGLVLWQGFSMGRPVYAINFSKTGQGIHPYTAASENNFFRGGAVSFKLQNIHLNLFVSKKKRDGNIEGSDSTGYYFTSLQNSGYHRTSNELADKNSVSDFNTGALLNYTNGSFKAGAVMLYRQFNMPFMPAGQLYNLFNFKGTENHVVGVDYLFSKGKYQLFGEAAVSKSGGKAAVQGITIYLHDRFRLSVLARHLDRHYHALWAAPFIKSSSPSNETGFFAGVHILPFKYVKLSAWTDYYRSGWIKYTTAGPSDGWDIFVQADVNPSSRLSFNLRYKNEEKYRKIQMNAKNQNRTEETGKSRVHVQYQLSSDILLKARMEHVLYKGQEKEHGIMLFQDVRFAPAEKPLNFTFRLAWFNTGGYNSRIYAYENDLLYAFAIPAFSGTGFRSYLNLRYKLNKSIDVWFKLSNSLFPNIETISSGYSEIDGNQKTELKLQLRLKL